MSVRHQLAAGFTLIELIITIAIVAVFIAMAVPTFNEFRQRSALQGAADQVASFWADARFEALRRNEFVVVGVRSSGANYCLGADVTDDETTETSCDCFTAGACEVSVFPTPGAQEQWRGVTLDGLSLGSSNNGITVLHPKRGNVVDSGDEGAVRLKAPDISDLDYRLNVVVDRNGRAFLCEPAAAPSKLPRFSDRKC